MTRQTNAPLTDLRLTAGFTDVEDITRGVTDGRVIINPPYQRGSVWTTDQRIALMRSWLMGLPVGAITLNSRMGRAWLATDPECRHTYAVVDGRQRIETTLAWRDGSLAIPASWLPAEWATTTIVTEDGPYVTVKDLTTAAARIVRSRMTVIITKADVPTVQQEAEIFLLVNGTGTPQTAGDLANAARVAGQ